MLLELGQDTVGAHDEHAAVPHRPVGHELPGGLVSRLLDEAGDAADARQAGYRQAGLDPAEPGLRPRRGDAEGDEPAVGGGGERRFQCTVECLGLEHQVVRRADPQDRVAAVQGGDLEGAHGDRGRGVARAGLQEEVAGQRRVDALVLAADEDRLPGRRHRGDAVRRGHAQGPAHGRLQQRFLAEELDQVLGEGGAADRPQPGAGAAGEEQGDQTIGMGHRHRRAGPW